MLETLHIRNLALVPELNLEFGPGLNIVTGETGAGKSLIIGAIQLLTGARATPAVIRKGEKSCEIEGVLLLKPQKDQMLRQELDRRLEEGGIPLCEEDRLLIRRIITESGSRAYVNGAMVTASLLRELTEDLIDLHGPHDNQTLLVPARQLLLLDTYAATLPLLKQTQECHARLRQIQKEKEDLQAQGLTPEELSLLQYQLQEIREAEIQPEEEEALTRQFRRADNAQKLLQEAASAQQALNGDGENSVSEILAEQLRSLREWETLDPEKGAPLVRELEALAESAQELGNAFGEYAESMDLDREELQRIEQRLDLLQKLKRKYGPTLEDVLQTAARLQERIDKITHKTGRLQEIAEEEAQSRSCLKELCDALTRIRREKAPLLAAQIQEKLRHLGFLKSAFQITLQPTAPGPAGQEQAEFRFAPNVGEDFQALKEVASSGEIARVMLAIKTVLSDADAVPILIFDEIDANVGGVVARTVAEELHTVATRHQVFSITHLPQIAAAGDRHYLVQKNIVNDRTETRMTLLTTDQRIEELVRMLGADSQSGAAREHAGNLLAAAHPDTLF